MTFQKPYIFLLAFLYCIISFAQDQLIKDIDFDNISDTIYIDRINSRLVAVLSSYNYIPLHSKPFENISNAASGLEEKRNGFEFFNHWMRSGYTAQFRFEPKTNKIQLIGLTSYSLGNATLDGSGESSYNLLTGDYLGDWNFFDPLANNEKGKLIKLKTIKTKIDIGIQYWEDFSDSVVDTFLSLEQELIRERREKLEK